MDDPSALKRPIFKLLFWGVVVPIATLTLVAVAYLIVVLGIEHY
jgi:hypothetical protein